MKTWMVEEENEIEIEIIKSTLPCTTIQVKEVKRKKIDNHHT